jgi:pilus assembly protein CpaB
MGRRTLLVLAALVVAALGTVLVYLYVQGLENEYAAGQEPVQVLVANTTIAAGTTGAAVEEEGAFTVDEVPRDLVVPGAISSMAPVADHVAIGPIFPGEQLIESKFDVQASSGLTFEEGSGQFATSVQLSDPARVAGFVKPGSNVVIFVTLTAADSSGEDDGGSSAPEAFTRVLLPRVPVVAVGNSTVVSQTVTDPSGQQTTEEIPAAILTLGVTQGQALQIVHAQSQGELYFGLLDENSDTQPGGPVDNNNLFGG